MHPLFVGAQSQPTQLKVLVGLADWNRFTRYSQTHDAVRVYEDLNQFYLLTEDVVEGSGGTVLKFMGDSALTVFAEDHADAGIMALLDLKQRTDHWFHERRIDSALSVNCHFGDVMLGPTGHERKLDVFGVTVNTTATLGRVGFKISPQAFRCLTAEHRKAFHRYTPPVLYYAGVETPE